MKYKYNNICKICGKPIKTNIMQAKHCNYRGGKMEHGCPYKWEQYKGKAHSLVSRHIRIGKIIKEKCYCGKKGYAHHDDYEKPLIVLWLCRSHHAKRHLFLAKRELGII